MYSTARDNIYYLWHSCLIYNALFNNRVTLMKVFVTPLLYMANRALASSQNDVVYGAVSEQLSQNRTPGGSCEEVVECRTEQHPPRPTISRTTVQQETSVTSKKVSVGPTYVHVCQYVCCCTCEGARR